MSKTTVQVTEKYAFTADKSKINRDDCTIADVKLLGWTSRNNAVYNRDAFGKAAHMYDGATININHGTKGVEATFGRVQGVDVREDGIYAKHIKYNPKLPMTEGILWYVDNDPKAIGMSPDHVVTREMLADGKKHYTGLVRVNSIDIVRDPATTQGVFESMNPDGTLNDVTPQGGAEGGDGVEQFKAQLGELMAAAMQRLPHDKVREIAKHMLNAHGVLDSGAGEGKEQESLQNEVKTLKTQLANTNSKLEAYTVREQTAAKKVAAVKLCEKHGLSRVAVTEQFIETIHNKTEADAVKDIEDRKAIMTVRESVMPTSTGQGDARMSLDQFTKFALTGRM